MLGEISLMEFFELASLCNLYNLSLDGFYQMVPWHLLTVIDIINIRHEEAKSDRNQLKPV